jgi:hypothetical protein
MNTYWAGVCIEAAGEGTEDSPPRGRSDLGKRIKSRKLNNGKEQQRRGFLQAAVTREANAGARLLIS